MKINGKNMNKNKNVLRYYVKLLITEEDYVSAFETFDCFSIYYCK